MTDQATPAKVRFTDGLGPDVTAWVCEYISGEVFVSLAREPMNDPDVRQAWRLLTMRERDAQVAAAVAAEREKCANLMEHAIELTGLNATPAWQQFTAKLLAACAALIRAA